jgi:hypothetical protein
MATEQKQVFPMTDAFVASERGNIYLVHIEENWHNAWINLFGFLWLEISIRPCNYPALNVACVSISDEKLAEHINKEFGGGLWKAMKMNIQGVKLDEDSTIIGTEEVTTS